MKTIKVEDSLYEKLVELSTNINNQDHRCTAMPYFFQVQTQEIIYVPDGCGAEAWYWDEVILKTDKEINDWLYDWFDGDKTSEEITNLTESEKKQILEEIGYRKVNYNYENKYQNAFLTEKSCKKHIRLNKHHYNQPVDYLSHAFRNPDLETIFEFLCSLTGKKIHI